MKDNLDYKAMEIVNTLYELAGVPASTRIEINDAAFDYVNEELDKALIAEADLVSLRHLTKFRHN